MNISKILKKRAELKQQQAELKKKVNSCAQKMQKEYRVQSNNSVFSGIFCNWSKPHTRAIRLFSLGCMMLVDRIRLLLLFAHFVAISSLFSVYFVNWPKLLFFFFFLSCTSFAYLVKCVWWSFRSFFFTVENIQQSNTQ